MERSDICARLKKYSEDLAGKTIKEIIADEALRKTAKALLKANRDAQEKKVNLYDLMDAGIDDAFLARPLMVARRVEEKLREQTQTC